MEVTFLIIGTNNYVDYFQDKVDMAGRIHIWWKNRPEIEAHVSLDNSNFVAPTDIVGRTLTVAPGEHFYVQTKWHLYADDGQHILDLLDYSENDVRGGLIYAKPEQFMVQAQMTVFNQIGLIKSNQIEFTFNGYKPYSPPD
jgi:hypothetical protein